MTQPQSRKGEGFDADAIGLKSELEFLRALSERDALREGFQAAVLVLARHDPKGARRWLAENGHA